MKIPILLLSLLTVFELCGQEIKRDTAFLLKDTANGKAHSIFIDPDHHSNFYQQLTNFTFDDPDSTSYAQSLQYLKNAGEKRIKRKVSLFFSNWVELRYYKKHFYAYKPCNFYHCFAQSINDTTLIDWTGEGPIANKTVAAKLIDPKTCSLQLTSIHEAV